MVWRTPYVITNELQPQDVTMVLNENQSALILQIDDKGDVGIDVASQNHESLTAKLCNAIAIKLQDEEFQEELLQIIEENE